MFFFWKTVNSQSVIVLYQLSVHFTAHCILLYAIRSFCTTLVLFLIYKLLKKLLCQSQEYCRKQEYCTNKAFSLRITELKVIKRVTFWIKLLSNTRTICCLLPLFICLKVIQTDYICLAVPDSCLLYTSTWEHCNLQD